MKKALKEVLTEFRKNSKAIMAFNAQNMYQIEAAMLTAQENQAPILIQFSERFLRFLDKKFGLDYILRNFKSDFIYFHLDHCVDIPFIQYCVDAGFDSVMYDGSAYDLETNIEKSNVVISYAEKHNCLVEGELGKVAGVEDGFGDAGSSYAELDEIAKYVEETRIDLMALGIGNAHGFYSDLEGLNIDILKNASDKLDPDQFFVLHGATGLPEDIIREAIGYGVVKINVSTHLKKKTMEVLQQFVSDNQLYNEIAFHTLMMEELSHFYKSYINKYTI